MKLLKRMVTPPVFDDELETQQAYILHVILWTLVCVPVPYVLYTIARTPENTPRALIQAAFGETVNVILLIVLKRGHVKAASIMQVGAFWLFFTVTAISESGVQGEAYLIGYTTIITIAGILLGGRGATVFTVLCLGAGFFMAGLQERGGMDGGLPSAPFSTWIVSLILFPLIAILQNLASSRVQTALTRARASEEKYRLISRVSSDYTFSTELDAEGNMRLNWVAGAFESMTGYTFEEYSAHGGWPAHLHPDDVERDSLAFEKLRTNQQVVHELRTRKKDGSIQWVRVYAHPIWDERENRLVGIVGAVQDITERKLVEQEREALIRELEAKNAELERFTYTVSHDLKSPLVTITGFLGFIERDAATGNITRVKRSIARIADATEKMETLLNDLLELSRIGRVMNPPDDIPFGNIVNEAIDRVRGRLDEADAIVEIQRDFPIVRGDRVRLIEVIQNLVENAVKYSKPGVKPRIEIGWNGLNEMGHPVFFVRDNGVGIEPQYHERVFGLFNKLNAQSEGTGIGLSLVKRIIEVHNGRIWIESEKGKGATFHFFLPTPQTKE